MLLRTGLVDCENWDAFSVWAGRHKMSDAERQQAIENSRAGRKRHDEANRQRRDALLQQIRQIIESGNAALAAKAHERMSRELPDWRLPERDLLR